MKRSTQIILAIISLSLIAGFVFPLWDIELEAPQYPEGLGMQIWINSIQGDLNTINGLNHYIGMKEIVPDSIPELSYMKYILSGLIVLGLIAALLRNKYLFYIWILLFITAGVAGGLDFYSWEYDYGHDLNPRAAIKIPGMNYQPPLWGSKQLLNFTAHSYPHTGGWIIIFAGAAAMLLLLNEIIYKKSDKEVDKKIESFSSIKKTAFASLIISIFYISCSTVPIEIKYGQDECQYCRMTIIDNRFGTELINAKGKAYKFDSVECLIKFINNNEIPQYTCYVTQFSNPGVLVLSDEVKYLISEDIPSPMGENISAHSPEFNTSGYNHDAVVLNWNQLINYNR